MHSATVAVEEAARRGVHCQIVATVDRGDATTRACIQRFAHHLAAIHEVDFGELSVSRNYAIERINSKYLATLDGDDCIDRDWLWKGVRFLEAGGDENVVAHPEVRLSFGNELHGRIQISTEGRFFHPLNLISSWHYAADFIIPTRLYQQCPLLPNDYEQGMGAEDWHWTCESIVEGIRHLIVPETCSFYRRQANHVSLGMLPSLTFSPTRLLEKKRIEALSEARLPATIPNEGKPDSITAPREHWKQVPRWVERSARQACQLDFEFYDLYKQLDTIPFETPGFFPAVGKFYLHLMQQVSVEKPCIVFVCDKLGPQDLSMIEGFLAVQHQREGSGIDVLVLALQNRGDRPGLMTAHPARTNAHQHLRFVDLGGEVEFTQLLPRFQQDVIVRFFMQTQPRLVVNLNSTFFDQLSGEFGRAVTSGGTQTLRICPGVNKEDEEALASWQSLAKAAGNYTGALCESADTAAWLRALFNGTSTQIYSADKLAFGEALFDLFSAHQPRSTLLEYPAETSECDIDNADTVENPDISCIVTAGTEGHYLNSTLLSVAMMCKEAARKGLSSELVIVAHCAGHRTRKVLENLPTLLPAARVVFIEESDIGKARNAGIEIARGRFIAMLTGADLVSPSWLYRAVEQIEAHDQDMVAHPHAVLEFSSYLNAHYQPDMDNLEILASGEAWTAHAVARRELFLRVPYLSIPDRSGYGHSAWHWNCETVMAGVRHVVIKDTTVYRRQAGSSGERNITLGAVSQAALPATRFFSEHAWLQDEPGIHAPSRRIVSPEWNDDVYLSRYADVRQRVATGEVLSGYDHYLRDGSAEGRVPAWKAGHMSGTAKQGPARTARLFARYPWTMKLTWYWRNVLARIFPKRREEPEKFSVPAWLDEEMQWLSNIEPALRVSGSSQALLARDRASPIANAYRKCWQLVASARPTHIIILPALRLGGAELSAFFTIQAILSSADNRVLVITTDHDDHRWRDRLPDGCAWLPFTGVTADCFEAEREEILLRLLLNLDAQCLHISYSRLGWQVLRRHAAVLADRMRLFVSISVVPLPESKHDAGYARFLPSLIPHLAGVMTDNEHTAGILSNICGIERGRVTVLQHPRSRG